MFIDFFSEDTTFLAILQAFLEKNFSGMDQSAHGDIDLT
jgi:hypothetical protein